MHPAIQSAGQSGQCVEIIEIIAVSVEAGRTIVPALDDVPGYGRDEQAGVAGIMYSGSCIA
jgi:hypothetical protein